MHNRIHALALSFLMVFVFAAGKTALAAGAKNMNLVLIPARVTMVQAAFELARLRPATIVTCEARKNKDPLLHVWDGAEWIRIELSDLAGEKFLRQTPDCVIVIGGDDVMPVAAIQAVSWCDTTIRVPSMKPVDIVNTLTEPLAFTKSELAWLAGRFHLNIVDLNADRKKYDPYAVPWSEILPMEKQYRLMPASEPKPATVENLKPPP